MHWSEPYIGLPWQDRGLTRDGIACWGLARLVYAEVLGLDVPDYAAEVASLEDRAEVATVYAEGTMLGPWHAVPELEARQFDILVFRRGGLDAHVGIVIAPGRMLHITSGQDSAIVSYADGRWAPRLSGVYRHRGLLDVNGADRSTLTPALWGQPASIATSRVGPIGVDRAHPTASRNVPDGHGGQSTKVVLAGA